MNDLNAKSVILVHLNSGDILFQKNADQRLPNASLTKIMTALLVIEEVQKETIHLNDHVRINYYAESIIGSRLMLKYNDTISVNDLLKGLMIASGNDAAVALAAHTEPSIEEFVQKMNQKAKEIGLVNTHFTNPHGLHSSEHYSSARDIATLSQKLIEWKPILQISSLPTAKIFIGQAPKTIKNTNPLIGTYRGADGLKTGYTPQAGFCLVATAMRNNHRVLAIVLGEPSREVRNNETIMLLDYAFSLLITD
nr:D-alanyl-D-alanine carboxypeptidase family protein [Peribacillus kribbensis]